MLWFTYMLGHAQIWAFPWKNCIKDRNQTEAVQHEKQCAKIDKVTPECLLRKNSSVPIPLSAWSMPTAAWKWNLTGHILPPFQLVAEIFNQLNNPILIWKTAFKHYRHVLLLYWTVLYIVAMFGLWCWRPGDNQALEWSPQKRQDRDVTEPPGRGWQQLPGDKGQGLGVLLLRAGRSQTSRVPCHGVQSSRHYLLVHGGAGVWDDTPEHLRNPLFRGNMPVQRAWQVKGRRGHRAFHSWVPWSMMQIVGDTSVALSGAVQDDVLQTSRSSQTNLSLQNCCMQIPTL